VPGWGKAASPPLITTFSHSPPLLSASGLSVFQSVGEPCPIRLSKRRNIASHSRRAINRLVRSSSYPITTPPSYTSCVEITSTPSFSPSVRYLDGGGGNVLYSLCCARPHFCSSKMFSISSVSLWRPSGSSNRSCPSMPKRPRPPRTQYRSGSANPTRRCSPKRLGAAPFALRPYPRI